MFKQTIKLFSIFIICVGLLANFTGLMHAQSTTSNKFGISEQDLANQAADPNTVTWQMLGLDETNLVGPYDSLYLSFNLPADWKLIEGASLNLSLGISISGGIQEQSGSAATPDGTSQPSGAVGVGTLTVTVNDNTVALIPIDQVGEVVRTIPIPIDTFTLDNDDGFVEVRIILNSSTSCYNFDQMNVIVRPSSYFTLPHESLQPSTDLVNFPSPIVQGSFIPDAALLVIPDQPSAAELQAALTVSAGLGRLSGDSLPIDMVTLSKLTPEQEAANDLIFVGKSSSLPRLSQLQLPLPVDGGQFQVAADGTDDGFVEMINSSSNKANVILVVSGNTDQGIIKSAQAVSTGIFQPNQSPNLAVVQEVQTTPILAPQPTDQTLAALGYQGRLFESRGINNATFFFHVPHGWTAAPDSTFELVYGHSALLNYASSGIVVMLNGKPVGSVRLNDTSAGLSMNKVLINLPTSGIVPGRNRIDVRVNLVQQDICAPPNLRGLWINIWPESNLHLPLDLSVIDPLASLSLASYPAPFIYYPLLDNTAFVLMQNDLDSWRAAATMASFLGSAANGPVTALQVFYADNLPDTERSKYNLLIVGRPSQMPVVAEINRNLPIPFLDGTDVLAEGNFQVTYRISSTSSMGYVELVTSPWNPDNIILAVLGNSPEGLKWATLSLIDPELRGKLGGNFAVINDQQIITTDTRMSLAVQVAPTPLAEVVVNPPNALSIDSSPVGTETSWLFPAMLVSIVLIIIISAFVAIGSWSRNRTRGMVPGTAHHNRRQGFFDLIRHWFSTLLERKNNRHKDN
jgi:cellulose synthase operon protein B